MTTRPVLLVVDVQNGFVNEDSAHVVPVIVDLVRHWRDTGNDVIFTRYYNYPGSPYERLIGWYELQGPPQTDLVPELVPFLDAPGVHVLDKQGYSAFTEEGYELLAAYTDLYIGGVATDGCVLKTALDAFENGYTPWVLEDACASNTTRHPAVEVHRSAVSLMARLVGAGQVIKSADALSRYVVRRQG